MRIALWRMKNEKRRGKTMEDIIVTYSVPQVEPFRFLIVLFISVTGLSAGSYLASFIFTYLGKKEYLPLAKFSALAVIALWALAPLLLLLDIGQPLRFWHLFAYFNPQSPLTWGTVILTIYPVLGCIYLYFLFREELGKARMWGFIGLPVALGSHAFVGFVLSFSKARVLWSSSLTPIFFLLTAALSGLALVVILDSVRYFLILKRNPGAQDRERLIFHQLGEVLYLLIFADLGLILFYLMKLGTSPALFKEVLSLIAGGKIGPLDLVLPLGFGLVVPLALLILSRTSRSPWAQLAASILIVLGTVAMGHLVLYAAQSLPLV
jgi:Ni/Fe-hydrogenase subunit HybB-like protein